MRHHRPAAVLAAAATAVALTLAPTADEVARAAQAKPTPGAPGSGDSLFPSHGNGGYDVRRYGVKIRWYPTGRIVARTNVRAVATQSLSRFNLDLSRALKVSRVLVNGRPATIARSGHELAITPARPLPKAKVFRVKISYAGVPRKHIDPDGSSEGWITTSDGATAVNEPVGSYTWMPVNNTIRDKARYTFSLRVPNAKKAVANGTLAARKVGPKTTLWRWRQAQRISPYLAMVSIGRYDVVRNKTAAGIRSLSFLDPSLGGRSMIKVTNQSTDYWTKRFGAYPFNTTGAVVDSVGVGYALETATRPVYDGLSGDLTVVHEIAHQWYGNAVTPRDWKDLWLNEGPATYAEWLWQARTQPGYPAKRFRELYRHYGANDAFWKEPAGSPTAATLFGSPVYVRGAMTLQALREEIGSRAFFRLMRQWYRDHKYRNVTTAQFTALAEQVSGKQLDRLFHDWLYAPQRPQGY